MIKRPFATGSKSEHEAICLVDGEGRSLKLRRLGGDPYTDAELERLVGKHIVAEGRLIAGNTVLLSTWRVVVDEPQWTGASRTDPKPRSGR